MHTSQPRTVEEQLSTQTLVKHYAGSIAYGTNLPTSDVDFRGIFAADPINIRTPFFPVREVTDVHEEDTKLYELTHFCKLCLDCNPNIVETLWVDESSIVHKTGAYDFLRSHRSTFLSKKIAHTTSGYAMAQLKRIKGHNKWINQPQSIDPPKQVDYVSIVQSFDGDKRTNHKFDLNDYHQGWRLVPYGKDIYGVYKSEGYTTYTTEHPTHPLNTNYDGVDREELGTPDFIIKFNKDVYQDAHLKWKQYWEWKENRNETRSALEEQFGFDTKHGMHLVRLLRMGVESLRDGIIVVKRPDAAELLAIRNGSMTYDELMAYAESMDKQIQHLYETSTALPHRPNTKEAANILMQTQDIIWSENTYD